MKKLMLNPAALRVESFDAGEAKAVAGTVRAHEGTWGETCVTQCATGPCDCMITIEFGC
ncbi:MAG TPA: hypothetical protein VFJ16_12250 [Longimicrobium sp.]|nr:hypothetical protein [Longimicrobium sp.]